MLRGSTTTGCSSDLARHAGALKTRGDHGDADCILHVRIDDRAKDQVDIRVSGFLDDRSRLVDVEEGQVWTTGDVEQDTPCAVDGDVQQLAGDGLLGSDAGCVFALGCADRHQRRAALGHDRAHVGKVQVDQTRNGDQLGDTLDALAQHIICHAESRLQVGALIDDLQQAVVGDHDQGVGLLFQLGDAASADWMRREPSKVKGRVTTPIVSAPTSLAICATIGAPPVPVPPPMPAVMKTMSEPFSTS